MSKTGINHFINSPEISRLINQNDWTAVYKEIGRLTVLTFIPVEFTDLIYAAGIDPLIYMEEVPPHYLSGDFGIRSPLKYINIPNNIKFIDNCAFSRSSLKEVKIPGDVGNAAFRSSDLEKVEVFEGVSFISRSFTDELYNVLEEHKNISFTNTSDNIKAMLDAVEKGRKSTRNFSNNIINLFLI